MGSQDTAVSAAVFLVSFLKRALHHLLAESGDHQELSEAEVRSRSSAFLCKYIYLSINIYI